MVPLLKTVARAIPPLRRLHDHRNEVLRQLAECRRQLASQSAGTGSSPFNFYNAAFDPIAVMHRHAVPGLPPREGYLTNFLGVLIDPKFLPEVLAGRAGQVEGIPIPANWHADIAEWGAALRAVDLARESFTVIELGCGWGCWLNNTGAAARRAGLDVRLIGVEGDPGHIGFAREACGTNGFEAGQVKLLHGIAAGQAGVALFPRQERSGVHWGLEPVFGATAEQREQALRAGTHEEVPMIALDELVASLPRVDLLHVDIQGGEADLIAASLPALREKVAYLVVGTHSRQIEGRIFDALLGEGWTLEIERPAILSLDSGPRVTVDGVQGWRNPRLAPA